MFNTAANVLRQPIREDVWLEMKAKAQVLAEPHLRRLAQIQSDADAWWAQQMRDMREAR